MKDLEVATLVKLLAGVLTPAALFYAAGYIIIQSYVISNGFNASFWFTEAFYREAGARFLLDAITAMVSLPHVLVALSLLTRWPARWLPAVRGLTDMWSGLGAVVSHNRRLLSVAAVALAGAASVGRDCDLHECASLVEWPAWFFINAWTLPVQYRQWLAVQPTFQAMALCLALAVPAAAALVFVSWRCAKALWPAADAQAAEMGVVERARQMRGALLVWCATTTVVAHTVLVYGSYFYDFAAVKLVDPDICVIERDADMPRQPSQTSAPLSGNPASHPPANAAPAEATARSGTADVSSGSKKLSACYLVTRQGDRYLLFALLGLDPSNTTQGAPETYVWQVAKLEPFAVDAGMTMGLRSLRPRRSP